jgi:hypothetical protein
MKYYKVGDKVQIKSREWFENNKNDVKTARATIGFNIFGTDVFFNKRMFLYCDKILEIVEVTYFDTEKGSLERVYVLDTEDVHTGNPWIWSENMIIGIKELRKKKLNKLKKLNDVL